MVDRRPLAVLVSGAPGSGKSTLARALGDALRMPVVDKDRIKEGRWRTAGRSAYPDGTSVELFYKTMELWLSLEVSVVGDMTLWRGVSEPDIAARIAPHAELVNVHCRTVDAVERFAARMRVDPLFGEQKVQELLPLVTRLQGELYEPLDLGCRTIVIDTTDGYDPPLAQVVAEINDLCH
jgi:predicted kinase